MDTLITGAAGFIGDALARRLQMTYASQKLIGETLVADFSRRGWVDGRSLRLSGVLARPPAKTGQLSAFMSDLIRDLAAGRSYVCPMSAGATTWAALPPLRSHFATRLGFRNDADLATLVLQAVASDGLKQ